MAPSPKPQGTKSLPCTPPGDRILLEAAFPHSPQPRLVDLAPVLLTMKTLLTQAGDPFCQGITIKIKSKVVEVKGKHGELKRDFKHLPIELFLSDGGKKVVARMYFAKSKQCSMLNSVCSHISNLFEGVAHKFEYKMRLVYAHFPINANIINGGKAGELPFFQNPRSLAASV
ncbi:RPL9 [Symbiodinium microadriaticum]|nr:RPL9 [Symbiodinium microadriaticum]